MNRLFFGLAFILAISFFGIGYADSVYAQIVPSENPVRVQGKAGEEVKGTVTLTNASTQDLRVKVYFEDCHFIAPFRLGDHRFDRLATTPQSCGKWVTFSPQEVDIPANTKQTLAYTVKIPKDAKGQYYSMLICENIGSTVEGKTGVSLVIRRGVIFFVTLNNAATLGKVERVSAASGAITGDLVNAGDTVLYSTGSFYIMNKEGMVVSRGDLGKFNLPAREKTTFDAKVDKNIPAGSYTMVASFDVEGGAPITQESEITI